MLDSTSDLDALANDVQRRFAGVERQIRRRDVREVLAALLVVGIFGALWPSYRSSPVAVLGVALICAEPLSSSSSC